MKKYMVLCLITCLVACSDYNSPGHSSRSKTPDGVEAVDLGLSVKWANMNVGAEYTWDDGDRFAWGETKPKKVYEFNSVHIDNFLLKYKKDAKEGPITLRLKDDAAHVNWGGNWRMPTRSEVEELIENCVFTDRYIYVKVTGPNGNYIELPYAKMADSDFLVSGGYGSFWTSTAEGVYAKELYLEPSGSGVRAEISWNSFYLGHAIRPVCE